MTAAAAEPWLRRLATVSARLDVCARRAAAEDALTDADPATGERWDGGQVWAHLAEFPAYWIGEVRGILRADPAAGPAPFGRTKADAGRVAAIADDRHLPGALLHERVRHGAAGLEVLLLGMGEDDWRRTGRHPTLGAMDMDRIMGEFLVGHLEEHAVQLEGLGQR